MLVAVFERADGGVSVMYPNLRLKTEGESEANFAARIATIDGEKAPATAGRPFRIVNQSELPSRDQIDAQGDVYSVRAAWRLNPDGTLGIDEAKIEPNFGAVMARLEQLVPADEWLEGVYSDLAEAIRNQNKTRVRRALMALIAAVPSRAAAINRTISEKRL